MSRSGVVQSGLRARVLSSVINAPTTLPPPLELPSRDRDTGLFRHLIKVGKAYLGFYKAGARQVMTNRRLSKQIKLVMSDRTSISIPGDAVDHLTGKVIDSPKPPPPGLPPRLTRSEFQLVRRHAADLKKLAPFAVLFAVLGEWLPLFVGILTPILPGTVLLPKQIKSRRLRRAKIEVASGDVRAEAARLGVVSRYLAPVYPRGWLETRLDRHRRYLLQDDRLLKEWWKGGSESVAGSGYESELDSAGRQRSSDGRQGEVADEDLSNDELELALEERGLWKEDRSEEEMRRLLRRHVDSLEDKVD
ncbi:hypothetical protein PYCC9005_005441 [Savitreella phatthalungensis]